MNIEYTWIFLQFMSISVANTYWSVRLYSRRGMVWPKEVGWRGGYLASY